MSLSIKEDLKSNISLNISEMVIGKGSTKVDSNIDSIKMGMTEVSGGITVINQDGTNNYNDLLNKPQIEGVELTTNTTFDDIGLEEVLNEDILKMFK